ncbi:ABC transporter substrate-binding protein [Cohnella sp. GCM10020058]|uniref:ABC transporter substrate-binding protein n=1 Tax=Cohnella sp. GCM10020058 TaxID=3317330 RepID=UPI00362F631C
MKKWSLLLSVTLLMGALAACGSNNENEAGASESASPSPSASGSAAASESASPSASAEAQKPVKLKIYAQYSDDDTKLPYDYAAAELKKAMPNVELELDVQAQDDGQKLKTYAAMGTLPDIFQANLDIINTFKNSNNILQLDEYVDKLGFKDKMYPSTMNTLVTEDGHSYAFPYAGNEVGLLFYNKELFAANNVQEPKTYADLLAAVKTFKAAGVTPLSMFAKEKWPAVVLYDMFVTRTEPEGILKLDRGEAKASDPAYKQAAEEVIELVKAGLLPKGATSMNYDQAAALFREGKAAMFINGQWEIEDSTKALGDKLGYLYVPAADEAAYEAAKYNFTGGGGPSGYAVSSHSENKEIAAEVAAFLSEKYAEFKYTQRGTPIVATKVDLPVQKEFPPTMQQLADDIPNMKTTAFAWGLGNAKFKAAIEDASQSLLTGAYSADRFASDVDKAIEQSK